jgi:hypothetical protein
MMCLTPQTCSRPRGGIVPARGGGRGQVVPSARPKQEQCLETRK